MPQPDIPATDCPILVTSVNGAKVGLLVERFHREVDLIVKPLEGVLAEIAEFNGTALLGDGLVLLIVNVKEVFRLAAGVG
jgi:two-component system chemotaxis sensor kinase CheA